jgi:hypothetical protein
MTLALARFLPIFGALAASITAQAAWTRLYPPGSLPSARSWHAMTYHAGQGVTLLFGGQPSGGQLLNDFWRFDGVSWTQLPSAGPSTRFHHSMAFDEGRNRLVIFGGSGGSGYFDETWEWDGAGWSLRAFATKPAARWNTTMAYDPSRQRIVLFGGGGSGATMFNDLWEYDGLAWQQRLSTGGPGPRSSASLAFDPNTSAMLLFGGSSSSGELDETWHWNGTSWVQRFPTTPPFPGAAVMVTDLARSRVVLFGSSDPFVREWDGSQWHYQLVVGPAPRNTAMAYDAARRQVVLFGGNYWQDTWAYRTPNPASFTSYGTGCPGSVGMPVLAPAAYNLPWLGDSFQTRATSISTTSGGVLFVTGVAATPAQGLGAFGLPACSSFVTFDAIEFRSAANGAATWSIAVPSSTSLSGVHLFQQAFVLDAGAPGGAAASNAGEMILGIR